MICPCFIIGCLCYTPTPWSLQEVVQLCSGDYAMPVVIHIKCVYESFFFFHILFSQAAVQ